MTRRQMISSLLGVCAWGMVPGCKPRRAIGPGTSLGASVFDPETERTLRAAVERILPGALEAGVPEYVSFWLGREPFDRASDWKPLLVAGSQRLNRLSQKKYRRAFADDAPAEQDEILRLVQQGGSDSSRGQDRAFFQRLVTLTLEGFLSEPKYGGNRNLMGFDFIGRHPCWWAPRRL